MSLLKPFHPVRLSAFRTLLTGVVIGGLNILGLSAIGWYVPLLMILSGVLIFFSVVMLCFPGPHLEPVNGKYDWEKFTQEMPNSLKVIWGIGLFFGVLVGFGLFIFFDNL